MKPDFPTLFQALTGNAPLRWQRRLFARLAKGDIPASCSLPTGLGKTSVIPIWLCALASNMGAGARSLLPRRLIYIVNRRTVVDQATTITETVRCRILGQEPVTADVRESLDWLRSSLERARAFQDGHCLAVSTLRGELADNEEWKADPARAAIMIGTIDMIGSKLLFSGYGDGAYRRAHHAGLVGQETLIVHDEAHLTPPFGSLLRFVAGEQKRCDEPRPIRVMELSATTRTDDESSLTLEPEDELDDLVCQRLDAAKRLKVHPAADAKLVETITDLALTHDTRWSKVLIYVRSPEDATRVENALAKKVGNRREERIGLLTGTIRGYERDRLVKSNPVYRSFLETDSRPQATQYLVSTSAGEVGIDLDADHLVCDLSTLDSMIQRFGRVNRRGGEGRDAMIDVIAAMGKKGPDSRLTATLAVLGRLPLIDERHDASPRSVMKLLAELPPEAKESAWSASPEIAPATDILLDAWSLTSIRGRLPGRPEVADYLHGITDDPPETWVAWRWEVDDLARAEVDEEILTSWFRACRIEARERLRDRSDRVRKGLEELLQNHRKTDPAKDFSVVVLDERAEAKWALLSAVVRGSFRIEYRTIVLSAIAGGLDAVHGILAPSSLNPASDVAEESDPKERARRMLPANDEDEPVPSGFVEKYSVRLDRGPEGSEDEEPKTLALFLEKAKSALDQPETTAACQSIFDHAHMIAESASQLAWATGLDKVDKKIADALVIAARLHDEGKRHPVWQLYACNRNGDTPLAKSTKYLHGRALGGYRHELGSLLEAAKNPALAEHPERELILHLIASHHDWSRPHFEARALDRRFTTAENEREMHEAMRRFARLQRRFGRWGLAWLESLLRSADIAASRAATESTKQGKVGS